MHVSVVTRRADQDCFFILETLARELMLVARLRGSPPKSQGNRYIRNFIRSEECGVKAPIVTDVMPEVGRSRPGQGEVRGNPHGGPISF